MKRGVRRGDWVTGMCEVRFRLGQCFLASMMVLGRWCGVSILYLKSRACGDSVRLSLAYWCTLNPISLPVTVSG